MATSGVRFGKYLLEQRLGAGGMAEVWRAVLDEPGGRRTVVVKRVLPHLQAEPKFLEMFLVEARLSARLSHPNVVQIVELGEAEGRYYLAMELIDGRDLGSLQHAIGGPLPLGAAAFIVGQVCRALAYAHALTDERGEPLGLVHRDVTPSNVMISRDGAVKLVDFGVAKALRDSGAEHTRTGLVKGKAGYIAPEYLRGEGLDARSDLFGAGVVLHEALTGKRLFWSDSEEELLRRMRYPSAFPPSQTNPQVTPELDAICVRALAGRPDDRFPDAGAMAAALDGVAAALGFGRAQLVELVAGVEGPKVEAAPAPRTETVPRPAAEPARADALVGAPAIAWDAEATDPSDPPEGARAETTIEPRPIGSNAPTPRSQPAVPGPAATTVMRRGERMPRWFLYLAIAMVPLAGLVAWWLAGGAGGPPAPAPSEAPVEAVAAPVDAAVPRRVERLLPAPALAPPSPIQEAPDPMMAPPAPVARPPFPTMLRGPFRPRPGAILRNLPPKPMHRPLRIGEPVDPLK